MAIAPLQIPGMVRAPRLDFTPLNQIGDAFVAQRRKAEIEEAIAQATDPATGQVDPVRAGTALSKIGRLEEARPYMTLAESRANAARAQANTDRDFGLRQSEAARRAEADRRDYELRARTSSPEYVQSVEEARSRGAGRGVDLQINAREQAVRSRGLDPNDPGLRQYILSGKMPREDQQPLTATDKKAILEADEAVLANDSAIVSLKKAKELSPKAYEGPTASARGTVMGFMGSEAGQTTQELDNIVVGNALAQLKATFGAAPTEGERKILLELQGSAALPDKVRQKIFDRAIVLAEKRLEFNRKRAEELRGGTFYKSPQAKAASDQKASGAVTFGSVKIPIDAANMLKSDPTPVKRQQFDAIFGQGAADRVMGPAR